MSRGKRKPSIVHTPLERLSVETLTQAKKSPTASEIGDAVRRAGHPIALDELATSLGISTPRLRRRLDQMDTDAFRAAGLRWTRIIRDYGFRVHPGLGIRRIDALSVTDEPEKGT